MSPLRRQRAASLFAELLEVLFPDAPVSTVGSTPPPSMDLPNESAPGSTDREGAGRSHASNVLEMPRPPRRKAPPRPLGPVNPEAVERATKNLARRGFLTTEGRSK